MDVDESYRDAIGFDNRLPNFWFEVRKPLAACRASSSDSSFEISGIASPILAPLLKSAS